MPTRLRLAALATVAVFLLLAGALVPVAFPRPSPVTLTTVERVKGGMTQAEVEAILGGPPGDYRTRPTDVEVDTAPLLSARTEVWEGDEGTVAVSFLGGRVVRTEFGKAASVSVWEVFRWRLAKRWDRLTGPK